MVWFHEFRNWHKKKEWLHLSTTPPVLARDSKHIIYQENTVNAGKSKGTPSWQLHNWDNPNPGPTTEAIEYVGKVKCIMSTTNHVQNSVYSTSLYNSTLTTFSLYFNSKMILILHYCVNPLNISYLKHLFPLRKSFSSLRKKGTIYFYCNKCYITF